MTYEELIENYRFELVSENRLAECEPFSCGDEDLDDFFVNDAVRFSNSSFGFGFQAV